VTIPVISRTSSKLVINKPAMGQSPAGFERMHIEMPPREVGRLVGYDPRVLVMRPRKPGASTARGTRDILPGNVSQAVVNLQNAVQRSIDKNRVQVMKDYLAGALTKGRFADWGAIELVTSSKPDLSKYDSAFEAGLDSYADYFIADGQHRYCAILDFVKEHPEFADKFTQAVTISFLPEEKLVEWAGQEFHDRNFFSVPVRAGKALSVDSQDPVNALAKSIGAHPVLAEAGGIAYDRDTLLKGDPRFATHSTMHRFVRGFLFGRPGLDKGVDTRAEITEKEDVALRNYIKALGTALPWNVENRDEYVTRTSAVMSALSVIGHDLFLGDKTYTPEEINAKLGQLAKMNWKRTNRDLIGVVGSEKDGQVAPTSSRQAIDSTIRYMRQALGLNVDTTPNE
jgi:hypothetical protein